MTGEAYKLQNSTGKNATSNWNDYISKTSIILYVSLGVSVLSTALSWTLRPVLKNLITKLGKDSTYYAGRAEFFQKEAQSMILDVAKDEANETAAQYTSKANSALRGIGLAKTWQKVFYYAGIAFTCISIVLFGLSIWSTYNDMKEYYNAEFTPIPMHMVDEGVDDSGEKVFTYYTAVTCNRKQVGMVTDKTELLGDFGDLNGDVGRQWVALYTTKDKAAGNPVTTFDVRYESSNLPDESSTALSMFCESVAQNLTNEKAGYTYDDDKNGIYMFFNTDSSAFAASVFSNGAYMTLSITVAVVIAVAAFLVGVYTGKKKKNHGQVVA